MMGPKRIGIGKEPSGEHVDIWKKRASVSAALSRTSPQKIKESTSTIKKSTTLSEPNVLAPASTTKKQNQASPGKQIKRSNLSTISVTRAKTTPRASVTSTKNQVSLPKKSVQTPRNFSNTNVTREKNQIKEPTVDVVKSVNKIKAFRSKTESRLSVPLLHPVALIRDESKVFKEKYQNKLKTPRTATLTRTPRAVNTNAVSNEPKLIGSSSSTRFSSPRRREIDSATVCLDNSQRILNRTTDIVTNDEINLDLIVNRSYYGSELNSSNKELKNSSSTVIKKDIRTVSKLPHEISAQLYPGPEDICVCNLKKDSAEESSDNSDPAPIEEFKAAFEEFNHDLENSKQESNIRSTVPTCDNIVPSYLPSFYPLMTNEIDSANDRNLESLTQNQSKDDLAVEKNEDSDKREMLEPSIQTTVLQNLEGLSKEMKQSPSGTTMESSFDSKTFILEKPFEFPSLGDNTWEINRNKSDKLENEEQLLVPNNEKAESVQSVLQVNDSDELKLNSSSVTTNAQMIPEKGITEEIGDNAISNKPDVNVNEAERTSLHDKRIGNEDIFECGDTLEVLNLTRVCKDENNIQDISDEILFTFLPNQHSDKVASNIYDEDDEFASESEDVVQGIELGDSVWVDYKVPSNRPKPDNDGEIWILDRETSDESSQEDLSGEPTILFLEPDEQDWIITEKNLDDLRACLDECKEEAEYAAREINRLTLRNNYQTNSNRRRSNSSLRNKYVKKPNVMLNISYPKDTNVESNYESPNNVSNTGDIEDGIDYFSVSSSDEVGEISQTPADVRPQKNYLSFGKSCVKMKKKSEKKVLSFFNLFK